MKNKKLVICLIIGSLLGGIFASISLYQHVELVNELKVSPSFCNISESFNCDKVNESEYAKFLGVPIASYGVFYYLLMLFWSVYFLFSKKVKNTLFANVSLVFSTGAMLYSAYLFYISEFVIGTLCLNCIAMYIANLIQWLASLWLDRKTKFLLRLEDGALALTSFPFIALWSSGHDQHPLRKQATLSSIFIIFLAVFIINIPNNILLPHIKKVYQQEQDKLKNHNRGFYEWLKEPVKKEAIEATNHLDGVYYEGNKDAIIKIVEYADLQCPACRVYYDISKDFIKKYDGKILFVYKHFPLDGQCNSIIKSAYHQYACFASLFTLCAGEQGKYWDAMDYVYTMPSLIENKKDAFVQKEFREIIDNLGLDKMAFNECLESKRYNNKILSDIEEAKNLNITGTPLVFINGKQLKNKNKQTMEEIFNYILSSN